MRFERRAGETNTSEQNWIELKILAINFWVQNTES